MKKLASQPIWTLQPTWWSDKVGKQNVGPFLFVVIVQDNNKEEPFAELRPAWLDNAPQMTKKYRKELENRWLESDRNAIKEMNFFKWKFSYNEDGTVNILKLDWGMTFCADISGKWERMDWESAKNLAEKQWYNLLSDCSEYCSSAEKQASDWYKLKEYFGTYTDEWAIRCMLWCHIGYHWTASKFIHKDWNEFLGYACSREVLMVRVYGLPAKQGSHQWVCGRKKMETK